MSGEAGHLIEPRDVDWASRQARRLGRGRWRSDLDDLRGAALAALAWSAARCAGTPDTWRRMAKVAVPGAVCNEMERLCRRGFSGVSRAGAPSPLSLDAPLGSGVAPLGSEVPARPEHDPDPTPDAEPIRAAVRALPRPHRTVVAQLYGLPPYRWPASPDAIARGRGWDRSRVDTIRAEAFALLRESIPVRPGAGHDAA